jgi:hypothetical protein
VVAVALVCTQWFHLGDQAVFFTVAAGNVISAGVMLVLFLRVERALRIRSR